MSSRVTFAYCTFPSEDSAKSICEQLVFEETIACANIHGPVHSLYKWQGQLQKSAEWVAILKTSELKRATLMERIRAIHPYDNPCLVFLAIEDGLPQFLNWVYTQSL